MIAWYIFFHPLAFNLSVDLYLVCISCGQHIVAFPFFFFFFLNISMTITFKTYLVQLHLM